MIILPICKKCKHLISSDKWICEAYRNGIPDPILTDKVNHRKPYRGDNGIQFEELPDE